MTAPRPPVQPSSMLRPALALLAGLGVTVLIVFVGVTITTLAALRGVDPKTYVAPFWIYPTHLIISALGAMGGGFTTARITTDHSLFTVVVLALVLLMSALTPCKSWRDPPTAAARCCSRACCGARRGHRASARGTRSRGPSPA